MKKILVGIILVILVITAFFIFSSHPAVVPIQEVQADELKPFIEVVIPGVFTADPATNQPIKSLNSGDELTQGMLIQTDATGTANLIFANGSAARLDKNSSLLIEAGDLEPKDGTLIVRLKLAAGRVWSKIFALTTPASTWEVETSNAVAVVRGTAFGMWYKDGTSGVVGSENRVAVAPIDPLTKQKISGAEALITPPTFIAIDSTVIDRSKNDPSTFGQTIKQIPEAITQDGWVTASEDSDKKLESLVQTVRNRTTTSKQFYDELKKLIIGNNQGLEPAVTPIEDQAPNPATSTPTRINPAVPQVKSDTTGTTQPPPPSSPIATPPPTYTPPSPNPAPTPTPTPPPAIAPIVSSFEVQQIPSSSKDTLYFGSYVIYSDKTQKDVTKASSWKMSAAIGSFTQPGLFAYNGRYQEGVYVTATWTDPSNGQNYSARQTVTLPPPPEQTPTAPTEPTQPTTGQGTSGAVYNQP